MIAALTVRVAPNPAHPAVMQEIEYRDGNGAPQTVSTSLVFTTDAGAAVRRTGFSHHVWRPAAVAASLPATAGFTTCATSTPR